MARTRGKSRLSPEASADHAYAASAHLARVSASSNMPAPTNDPEAIAKAAARAVLDESQHERDRLERVLEALTPVIAQSIEAKQTRNGRELCEFERDPEKIGRFVRALARGNYRETACKLAGIATSSVRNWMAAAEAGDPRYAAVAEVIRVAEASAEDEMVTDVRSAGKDPRFWAASMTALERKFPDRWGRRQDDANTPRVVVQIGVKDSDVQVNLSNCAAQTPAATLPTVTNFVPLPSAKPCELAPVDEEANGAK